MNPQELQFAKIAITVGLGACAAFSGAWAGGCSSSSAAAGNHGGGSGDASLPDGSTGATPSSDGGATTPTGDASGQGDGSPAGSGDAAAVRLIGRMDTSTPGEPRFEWEGCSIQASFLGSQVSVTMVGDDTLTNYFAVFIDGEAQPTLVVNGSSPTSYPLATGLSSAPHQLLLFRRDESFQNPTQLVSLDFGPGGTLLAPPAAPTRRIEIIGDSISAGYGVECTNANTPFSPDTENEYLAYGSVTARALSAEAHVIAWSGEGVYRNYDSSPDAGTLMPAYWLRTLPTLEASTWDFALWTPDVVVVNLGTNDFSTTPPSDIQTEYQSHYLAFVQQIHATYPNAYVFCALGPMLGDPQLSEARTALNSVVSAMKSGGFDRIALVEFPEQDCGDDGGLCGCDYHPSAATQASMATQLEGVIGTAMGW